MSAQAIVDAFQIAFEEQQPRLTVINFANADMVGHTGMLSAAVRAVETVDECLGQVVAAVLLAGGACVITADHGNAEHMLDGGEPDTAHTCNPVPLIVTVAGITLESAGTLADVAPTVLSLLDIPQPAGMDGHKLLR